MQKRTVSASLTDGTASESSGPVIGGRAKKFMKKKILYTDEPMSSPKIVQDFLPPPKDLILKEDSVRITMLVSKRSFDFFKRQAAKYKIPYQKMIRKILDLYAQRHGAA